MDKSIVENVTVCLPVLNERDVISLVIKEWIEVIDSLPLGSEILIDEGGSKDGTVEIIQNLQLQYPGKIQVLWQKNPDGFGNSAKRLFSNANGYWIFFTDSDGQYSAHDFWKLWERRQNSDFVRGIKLGRQDPAIRRFASLLWNKSVNFLFEIPIHDVNSAFLLIKRNSLRKILPMIKHLPTMVLSEIVIRCVLENFRFGPDIYIIHRARKFGKSRATPGVKLFIVGLQQIVRLFRIKNDYRTQLSELI